MISFEVNIRENFDRIFDTKGKMILNPDVNDRVLFDNDHYRVIICFILI